MNEIEFFSLILMFFIRLLGILFSLEFYMDSKMLRYKFFMLGWFFLMLGGVFPFLSTNKDAFVIINFFSFLNNFFTHVGGVFLTLAFLSYFIKFNLFKASLIALVISGGPIILLFMMITSFSPNFLFIMIVAIYSYILLILMTSRKRKLLSVKRSMYWFFVLLFFGIAHVLNSITYLFTSHENITTKEIIYYFFSVNLMVLLLLFFIHLEHEISTNQKLDLKDKYSHSLGNELQAILSGIELIELKKETSVQSQESIKIIKNKVIEASKFLEEIRKL